MIIAASLLTKGCIVGLIVLGIVLVLMLAYDLENGNFHKESVEDEEDYMSDGAVKKMPVKTIEVEETVETDDGDITIFDL